VAGIVVVFWGCFHAETGIINYMNTLARSSYSPSQGFFSALFQAIIGIIWVIIIFIVWLVLLIPWAIWSAIFSTHQSGHLFALACVVTWLLLESLTRVDFTRLATATERGAAQE